ncbi:GlxA family transcriptional regulator [Chitinophaga rhizophila]|uniref:GlxA family transcriptional regulator n=1 Tax=Chitinophaga rhizophila TaxID=2866212 RepID=A0ABS7GLM8_9BACT|nr:GlxA family transcriptional regulator [Chitinophaga rhizophila]MBW8687587.1 GlxA family transcriptional regulator [Chitinophaga rhizophila]
MPENQKKLIVIVPMPGTYLLDIAGPLDVFTAADKMLSETAADNDIGYEIVLASPLSTRKVATKGGLEFTCPAKVDELDRPIDTLIVAGFSIRNLETGRRFCNWLHDAYPKMRRIGSVCIGTYALAEAGILHGRQATTHWEHSQEFQRRYPDIQVDTNPFYTRDGNVYTSGGVASGIDLALALVEEDYGRDIALAAARKLVLFLKRTGYQSQFSSLLQIHSMENSIAGKLQPWMMQHLQHDLTVEELATHSNMSLRNFNRVFLRETGMTPAKFVEKLRIEVARKYLEDSDLSMEQIAEKCGLGGVVSMRRTFMRHMMVSPSDYRRTFRTSLHTVD